MASNKRPKTPSRLRKAPDEPFSLYDFLLPPHVSGLATWEWNIPANTVSFSQEWRQILRDPDDACLGPTTDAWWPRMHEEDVIPFMQVARDVVEGRTESYRTLFRVRRTDGTWAWLLSRGTVTEKSQGKAVRVLGTLMDVSELRDDVKFLHGSAMLGGAAGSVTLETAPGLIMRMDRELTPLSSNPLISQILAGRHAQTFDPRTGAAPGLDQAQLDFLRENVEAVLAGGLAVRKVVSFPTSYGHTVTGEYSFWPEYDSDGTVTAVMLQFADITDKVLAQRRASLNEMRLAALYRLTQMDDEPNDAVLDFVMESLIKLTNSHGGFLFFPDMEGQGRGKMIWSDFSRARHSRLQISGKAFPDELLGMTRDENGNADYRMMCNGNGLHPLLTAFSGELEVMRYITAPAYEQGRLVCLAAVCNKETDYKDDDHLQLEAFIMGAWHIIRRGLLNREYQRAKEAAEKASRVKDEFLTNISHELRTPLNGILGMLQLLDFSPLSEDQLEYVRTAHFSGQALLRIISDILDFSRMASGKMELENEPFNLRLALEAGLSFFQKEACRKGLHFSVHLDEAIPATLIGDGARVMQIVFNLVGNALKYTEKGGIRVDCSLLPSGGEDRVKVYLSVSDTGIGIPDDKLEDIFEAFTQLEGPAAKRYPGTGLGLGIVRKLVQLMNGSMDIESELGRGTAVHCSLCFKVQDEDAPARADDKDAPVAEMQAMDILVAEDDPVASLVVRRFLERAGQRPVCVPNGRMALEALRLYPFQCLFTDILMPEMDGMAIIRCIRDNKGWEISPSEETRTLLAKDLAVSGMDNFAIPRNLPIVTISAQAMTGDRERFLEAGADYYLSKPVRLEDLTRVLQKVALQLSMQERLLTATYTARGKTPENIQ